MDISALRQETETRWCLPPRGKMRLPAILYASAELVRAMDPKVLEQLANIAALPGLQNAAFAMPDAHWGYGFPIGGVAAFDAEAGGVVSAGGVGFDISCGVRTLLTGLTIAKLRARQTKLAEALFCAIPSGIGSTGKIRLTAAETEGMLMEGARWAVGRGYGCAGDLARTEAQGQITGALPEEISPKARERQKDEMGTLGSGNHYLEVQEITEIHNPAVAAAFGLRQGEIIVSMHCGSRGLGHQVATEFVARMLRAVRKHGLELNDPELACAPINSGEGRAYLGAMRAASNCALANRQIITQLVREVFGQIFGETAMPLLFDVSHNTCAVEEHIINGRKKSLFVHRKGATRALGAGHPALPAELRPFGQPVLIGGTMGTASYIMAGNAGATNAVFHSACHGAGRKISRRQAARQWRGQDIVKRLELRQILIRGAARQNVAEEAPDAYKDVHAVVDTTERAGLARKVARLTPVICIKG